MGIFWYAIIGMVLCFALLAFTGNSDYYAKLFPVPDNGTTREMEMYVTFALCGGVVICFFVAWLTCPLW